MIRLLLLLLQSTVTVGDTVFIERAVGGTGSSVIRPQPWLLGEIGLQLGPADVRHGAEGAVVRYALVLWYPGEHLLTMPGPVLVKRDGSSDTLPPSSVRVQVSSVLPANARKAELPPKPPRTPVPLAERSLLPLALLFLLVAIGTALAILLWRRRGPAPPPEKPLPAPAARKVQPFHDPETLRAWARAGEHRAALDGWGWLLAKKLAESTDLDETAQIQRVLDEIADSVFSPRGTEYFNELCRAAETVAVA